MTITVELTIQQIADAVRRLSPGERGALFRLLTAEVAAESNSALVDRVHMIGERKSTYALTRAELDRELAAAATMLLPDYVSDSDLTAFTGIDADDFHGER